MILMIAVSVYLYFNQEAGQDTDGLSEEAIDQVQDDVIVDEPPVRISQGRVMGIKNEKREWLIEADIVSIAEDRQTTIFENIREMIIYKEEEPHLRIMANSCIANLLTNDMEFVGEVVMTAENGNSLSGERILWHSEEERISSDDEVELFVDDHYIVAGGLSSNMEMTRIDFYARTSVTIKL